MSPQGSTSQGVPGTRRARERLQPLLSGLLIALVVTSTLGAAMAMGGSEQVLVAVISPTTVPTTAPTIWPTSRPTSSVLSAVPTLPRLPTLAPTSAPSAHVAAPIGHDRAN
jgi:hypothetical protein